VFRVTRNHSGNPELLAPLGGESNLRSRLLLGRLKTGLNPVPDALTVNINEMKEEKKTSRKRGKGGRPQEDDPATNCVMVRFTNIENAQFLTLFEESGMHAKALFIKARVFDQTFRVVKTDRAALEYVTKLTSFYAQYRALGVNYNQVVKELHSHFSEKKTLALLYRLESITKELVVLSEQIVKLSQDFKEQFMMK